MFRIHKTFCCLTIIFLTGFVGSAAAQENHNFLVGSEKITCDSLVFYDETVEQVVKKITGAGFRFQQSTTINRQSGFQEAHYYSCNTLTGYMIVKYSDELFLYKETPKELWDAMLTSGNPAAFYESQVKDQLDQWLQTSQ